MPESKPDKKPAKAKDAVKSTKAGASKAAHDAEGTPIPPKAKAKEALKAKNATVAKPSTGNPRWLVPTMLTLMIAGLAWIVLFYLSGTRHLPVPALENWNLAVGFGMILVGFGMTTQWK